MKKNKISNNYLLIIQIKIYKYSLNNNKILPLILTEPNLNLNPV